MFVSGLDLGQLSDFTALVSLQLVDGVFGVRRAHRWILGTPYTEIVKDLKGMYGRTLKGSTLVVDRTGVGVAVVEMIQSSALDADVSAWCITAGSNVNMQNKTVPKSDLVAAIHVGLGTDTLRVAPGLKFGEILRKELKTFSSKVTADRNETFAAWREADHDDLVLALALAMWHGLRWGGDGSELRAANAPNMGKSPVDHLRPGTFRNR